ncbi:MAG: short-chain dehydrogenase [Verrucomicrobia bacterium]|nr:MAG: short-chain dehydrogenase [Verrucomicrobiota bacterium]
MIDGKRNGKVAFITGANRGLGLETARELGKQGIVVILGARDPEKGEAAAAKLRDEGVTAEGLGFDVTKSQDHQKAYEYFAKNYDRLDILVNNAGVLKESQAGSGPNQTSAVPLEILRETFETNFFAPVALTQKLLPVIRKAPAGRIVNVSSILGSLTLHSNPNSPIYAFKTFAYDASKAALNAFTIHLAHELRDSKIKVNSAHPGWVKTEMGGPNAPMEPSEGGKTSAQLATVADDGPNGGFLHLGQPLPW